MLKQRILTAIILIPMTLLLLFYASPPVFCIVTGLIVLLAAWEWTSLMQIQSAASKLLYLLLIIAMFCAALFVPTPFIFSLAFLWWVIAILLMISYPNSGAWWGQKVWLRGVMGCLVLIPCWAAMNYIRNQNDGIYALLFLFMLIWGADTVAYFVGRRWGTTKLAAQISPGKTMQGFYGALIYAILLPMVPLWLYKAPLAAWPWGVALSFITVFFSITGDLFESMMKRQINVKDSSGLLPGHGGLLDRIDSLTAAAPIFALGGWLLGTYLS